MNIKNQQLINARGDGRKRPTLKTIAQETGLGITTVSRALKDAPDIGADTKARVREVAARLGYQPNRAGVRLRTGKTNVIALVLSVDEELMGLTSNLVYGLSEVLSGTPYHLILTPHFISSDPLAPIRYIIETGSADGVIISRTEPEDARVRMMTEHGIPFVTHGRTDMGIFHPWHDFDNERFAREAVEKLHQRGRRRIAVLQPPAHLTFHRHVRDGFSSGLDACGCEEVPLDTVTIDSSLGDIRSAVLDLLRSPDPPDGFISLSGNGAVGILAACDVAGLSFGREIDLVSKQPSGLMQWIRPQIIAMNEDIRLTGRELARAMLAAIDGGNPRHLNSISLPRWEDAVPA